MPACATGGLLYGSRSWRSPLSRRFAITLAMTAAGVATLWTQPNLITLSCVIYLCGLTIAPTLITGYSIAIRPRPGPAARARALHPSPFRQKGIASRVVPSPMAASASGKAKISGAGPSASPVRGIFTATFATHLRRAFQCLSVDGSGRFPIWL
jgi:hypothetical protein